MTAAHASSTTSTSLYLEISGINWKLSFSGVPGYNKYGGQMPRWANGGLARQIFTWHQIHLIETVPNGVWSRHFSKYPHNCLGGVMIG